jgi:AcrR family transcriptional regulator
MSKANTKEKVLDIAELLFISNGYKNTSLRKITSKANVNLAAVNYHFGDKKTLIEQVLDKYLSQLMPLINEQLVALNKQDSISVRDVLIAVQQPLFSLESVRENGTYRFLSLIASGYQDVQGHLKRFILKHYEDTLALFMDSIYRANPKVDKETLFWQLHFSLGAFVFAVSSKEALSSLSLNNLNKKVDSAGIAEQLIPYLEAAIQAEKIK